MTATIKKPEGEWAERLREHSEDTEPRLDPMDTIIEILPLSGTVQVMTTAEMRSKMRRERRVNQDALHNLFRMMGAMGGIHFRTETRYRRK